MHRSRHGDRSQRRPRGRDRGDRRAACVGNVARQEMTWEPKTLGWFLERNALERGSAEALVTHSGRFTFEDLLLRAKNAAGALQSLGIGRGDHVGILMGNDEKW